MKNRKESTNNFCIIGRQPLETTMKFTVETEMIYDCSLERAFKTPMLCDVSKVHKGKGIMPPVTHCTEDEDWGKPGAIKKVHVGKSFTQKGGFGSTDQVIERVENDYWIIEVTNFQSWMLGFYKFTGTWKVKELEVDRTQVIYRYDLHSKTWLLYPINWIFAKTFWKSYMNQVLRNIHEMAINEEPYLFE